MDRGYNDARHGPNTGTAGDTQVPEDLKARLLANGWTRRTAYIEPEANTRSASPASGPEKKEGPASNAERPASNAERKAKFRERAFEDGWRQLNIMAPNDEDARELCAYIAKCIVKKTVRGRIRAVLHDPGLIVLGRRVRRLRKSLPEEVRRLLDV